MRGETTMKFLNPHTYKYPQDVEEDDKVVGKILTRREAMTFGGVAVALSLVGCGSGGSNAANAGVAPVISTQPSSQTATLGSSATFSVVATGDNLSYQWYKGSTAIAGATASTYVINPIIASSEGAYYVSVSNSAGSVNSASASLSLSTTVSLPKITTQPVALTVAAGSSATFSVNATGANLTYQWYRGGVAIPGATSASYSLTTTATSDSGATFYAVVSNSAGSATSASALLTVNSAVNLVATPQVTEGPFFVDENLLRSDLVSPGSSRSTVSGGFPLTLSFTLYNLVGTLATPMAGAHIDIWHADAIGTYSDEASSGIQSESTTGQTWLRGYQVTGTDGKVTFQTIHPGWYTGRTPHIHVKIRTYNASGNVTHTFTTQMFFTDSQNSAPLASTVYQHGTRTVFNANDNVYSVLQSDGTTVGSHLMLNASQGSGSETGSFSLAFAIS